MWHENQWLKSAREEVGSSKDDEKEVPADLIAPQILARVVSLAYFAHIVEYGKDRFSHEDASFLVTEALKGLNIFIANARFSKVELA